MLRARAPRRLPGALRRGLTFWRRSIQARVVASTVILSAVVIAAVGWLLLQQTRDGLLDQRVDAVSKEVADEMVEADQRLTSASGQDADASFQRRDLIDFFLERAQTRGYGVVVAGPAGDGPADRRRRHRDQRRLRPGQRAGFPRGALRPARRHDGLDLHRPRRHRRTRAR